MGRPAQLCLVDLPGYGFAEAPDEKRLQWTERRGCAAERGARCAAELGRRTRLERLGVERLGGDWVETGQTDWEERVGRDWVERLGRETGWSGWVGLLLGPVRRDWMIGWKRVTRDGSLVHRQFGIDAHCLESSMSTSIQFLAVELPS